MKELFIEGNNGGDFIHIRQTKEQQKQSVCELEVGQCCVRIIDHVVPVEFICSFFAKYMDYIESTALEVMDYDDKDFMRERLGQIKKL